MSIELLNMDCMEYMATLPDKAFDLAIVDPPYGIGASRPNGAQARAAIGYSSDTEKRWDSQPPNKEYFNELLRVSVNQIVWGANYFTAHLPPTMGWICWYKTASLKDRMHSEIEVAFSSFQKAARQFECAPFIVDCKRIHPTQTPVKLYEWLLTNYAKPCQCILDTHLGSGSSAIAAHNLGFDFVGMELDEDYYAAACKRFEQHKAQGSLFIPDTPQDAYEQTDMLYSAGHGA